MKRFVHALLAVLILLAPTARADVYDDPASVPPDERRVPRYDPETEFLRSTLVPGWSQHRQGAGTAGWAYTSVAFLSALFLFGIVEVPWLSDDDDNFGQVAAGALYGVNALMSGFDAHRRAVDSNRENGWDLEESAALRAEPLWRVTLLQLRF